MSVVIEINSVDRSSTIDWTNVNLQRALTNQVDTLTFQLRRADSAGYKPAMLDDIKIIEDGNTIFGGQIIQLEQDYDGFVEYFQVTAKDYSFDMDRRLVIDVFQNMTIADIIESIKDNVLPAGYDTTNVVCPVVVSYVAFNYELPSKCFQQLADIANYDWYVDQDKKIFFFSQGSVAAPFNITDTSGNHVFSSLSINEDITSMRNSIIVRGGNYPANPRTELKTADGNQTTFLQTYGYANIVVKVDGVTQTVGIANINDPTLFNCLYDFAQQSIIFPDASKPTVGQVVSVSGNPYLPLITKLIDSASYAEYGEFQYKIVDTTINSKGAARDRARAEISAWAQQINDGSFDTRTAGLDTGQKINIQSDIRGLNQDYIISRISSTLESPSRFLHSVTLVSSRTYGMVEFLQKLLIEKDKQIVIDPNEILEYITDLSDTFRFTDAIGTPTFTTGPYVWDTTPPTETNGGKWNFATWS